MAAEGTVSTSRRQVAEDIREPQTQARERGIERKGVGLADSVIMWNLSLLGQQ